MRIRDLLLGVIFMLTLEKAHGKPQEPPALADVKCHPPVPFACFVHQWEETRNKGHWKHAFDMEKFNEKEKCEEVVKECTLPCPETKLSTYIVVADLNSVGLQFHCNPTKIFCTENKQDGCIPIRKVARYVKKGKGGSRSVAKSAAPSEHTTATTSALKSYHMNRTDTASTNAAGMQTTTPSASSKNLNDPWNLDLVEIETIILPVCRRGDTDEECKAMTNGRFCLSDSNRTEQVYLRFPWNDVKEICTTVEAPLGGGHPKWLVELMVKESKEFLASQIVWEFTGLPYDIIASNESTFLPRRYKGPMTDCGKYAESTESCHALPLCDVGQDMFTSYSIEVNNETKPAPVYKMATRTSEECEKPCRKWDDPKANECRVLDLKNFPLYRQGSPPFADFLIYEENIKRPSKDSGADPIPFVVEATKAIHEPNVSVMRLPVYNLLKTSPKNEEWTYPYTLYARPINPKNNLSDSDNRAISDNYWLSVKTNPINLLYKELNLVEVMACENGASYETSYCYPLAIRDSTTSDRGLSRGVIAAIVVGCLYAVCGLIILTALLLCIKKKKAAEGSKTTGTAKDIEEKGQESNVVKLSQTGQTAAKA